MQIELTPEIENAVRMASSLTGLSPTEITLRALADYTQVRNQAAFSVSASDSGAESTQDDTRSREAVERIIARSKAPDAPRLDLPAGTSIREWVHVGHKY